ncbi:TRAP transporter small permease subunit [Parasalinivibrio latis]|uniref:TRAP transporter small permease subunit n=1 Tax=Parasalinivibrio latis TaxID=2952610 RepID=UPI0030E592B5
MTELNSPSVPFADSIDNMVKVIGRTLAWSYFFLVLVILLQVVLRKVFDNGQIALEELQWHLYAVGVLFGLSYAEVYGANVRVDIFYHRFPPRVKAAIEVFTILFLLWPFLYVVFIHSLDFVYESWRVSERSNSPSGLPWRWLIKSAIPASMVLLGFTSLSRLIRSIAVIRQGGK